MLELPEDLSLNPTPRKKNLGLLARPLLLCAGEFQIVFKRKASHLTSRETRISEKKTDPDWDRGRSAPAPSVTKLEIGGLKIGYKRRMAAPNRMNFRKSSKGGGAFSIQKFMLQILETLNRTF